MGCGGGSSGDNEVKETAYEKELSKITLEQWNRFKDVYEPLFKDLATDVKALGRDEKNTVAGMVNAGVTKTYGDAQDATRKMVARQGLDPSSGASVIESGDVAREKATALSSGITRGASSVDDAKVANMQNVVNMARGDAGQAMQGISDIAGQQVADANQQAVYDQQSRNDKWEAAATVAGMGLSAYNNYKKPLNPPPPGAYSTTPSTWINPNK